jgi:hypothetical protein
MRDNRLGGIEPMIVQAPGHYLSVFDLTLAARHLCVTRREATKWIGRLPSKARPLRWPSAALLSPSN